ncbi:MULTISPECIES: hypothetical protein [Cytobacillus]|jgi:hypothetical protein|uniref:hypothetical protein n=1 Tax=Cytobacillus TaxID=2675230 RepID=UPI001D139945|nr:MULTISPECIES: hypothetical protein [Cytobacillus]MCC3645853.1 hypothetical protein [Cytobacillus oceanisediminis]MCS0652452.1 hypothetical protein [Cytobacillus firmus]MCU1804348.1 hypothetical protein [Cytobacillus firmus]WHY36044.1 hypothetical protein QNH44_09945 [Cytobacillus firmus]
MFNMFLYFSLIGTLFYYFFLKPPFKIKQETEKGFVDAKVPHTALLPRSEAAKING